jgi:hypothetical protein
MDPAGNPFEATEHEARLGLALFRKGVDSIRASRPGCSICSRRPLIGETLWLFSGRGGDRRVCASCVESAAARQLGDPVGQRRVGPDAGTVTLRRAA